MPLAYPNPPGFFAARPVVAPKALFIGVCICLPWGRGAISESAPSLKVHISDNFSLRNAS
eukprot:scaffold4595_cov62-Phaeocystis_antarctica.AAC.1